MFFAFIAGMNKIWLNLSIGTYLSMKMKKIDRLQHSAVGLTIKKL